MKKISRLTESDLKRIIKRVIKEDDKDVPECDPGTLKTMMRLIKSGDEFELKNIPGNSQEMLVGIVGLYDACRTKRDQVFK